jgi:two-component system, OmpR family, sensor histidine kinase VicK
MSNVKQRMDIFFDYRAPSIVVDIAEYRKIRAFTEITKDNLRYCKESIRETKAWGTQRHKVCYCHR